MSFSDNIKCVKRQGLQVSVCKSMGQETWEVHLNNLPGIFEPLDGFKPLTGFSNAEEALAAGCAFVDAHQWELIDSFGYYMVWVRLWWDGVWGYSVRSPGYGCNSSGFRNRRDAMVAGMFQAMDAEDEFARRMQKYWEMVEEYEKE